ncbi:MAG: TIGR03000 domain-containing protein [Gemmataceae bacterium]
MYSLVLMAALTTGGDAPAFCWSKCGCGCWGCGCWGCHKCGCGCWGCHKCGCGCYGCGCYGCHGCYGCYGCHGCYGCYGCYGCHGCHCAGYSVTVPVYTTPATPPAEMIPAPKPVEPAPNGSARLIINVPEDAKLYIDDHEMKTPAGQRVFRTPQLEAGQTYYYIVRAEVERDGQTISDSKRVLVRAGETVTTAFAGLGTSDPNIAVAAAGK